MRVAVAASGGRDSTALLHCTARAAAHLGLQVHALHVHHGLSAQADDWSDHVQAQVRRWARRGLPLVCHVQRVPDRPRRGDSVEAWARTRRYALLAAMARAAGCGLILLAHHRRDQAETVLLQALRGAGPAGLAAMPRVLTREGLSWVRPWLDQPRESIEAYVHRHRLSYVDDGSNEDLRFARNRLRLHVWPRLVDAFPDAEVALSLAASRAQESAVCLRELALKDHAEACDGEALNVARWLALSESRRANLLRWWLPQRGAQGVPESLLRRLIDEAPLARNACWPLHELSVRRYRGRLFVVGAAYAMGTPLQDASPAVDLSKPGRHVLPGWPGHLLVQRAMGAGVPAQVLRHAECGFRHGREQFQLAHDRPARSLKKQYQALGIPEWQRTGPLIHAEGRLIYVPGLGTDARCMQAVGPDLLTLHWEPDVSKASG